MAVWNPKTDWNSSQQGVSSNDFNRIEGNTQYLYDVRRYTSWGSPYFVDVGFDAHNENVKDIAYEIGDATNDLYVLYQRQDLSYRIGRTDLWDGDFSGSFYSPPGSIPVSLAYYNGYIVLDQSEQKIYYDETSQTIIDFPTVNANISSVCVDYEGNLISSDGTTLYFHTGISDTITGSIAFDQIAASTTRILKMTFDGVNIVASVTHDLITPSGRIKDIHGMYYVISPAGKIIDRIIADDVCFAVAFYDQGHEDGYTSLLALSDFIDDGRLRVHT